MSEVPQWDTEAARAERRKRIVQIKPRAASTIMSEAEFRTKYLGYHYIHEPSFREVEDQQNIMFCPACMENEVRHARIKARALFASYEPDPLQNYGMLASMRCEGCGWQEIIPVGKFVAPSETDAKMQARRQAQMSGMTAAKGNQFIPQLWSDEIMRQMLGPPVQNSALAQAAQQQQAMNQALQQYHNRPFFGGALNGPPPPRPSDNPPMYPWSSEIPPMQYGRALAEDVWTKIRAEEQLELELAHQKAQIAAMAAAQKSQHVLHPPVANEKPSLLGRLSKALDKTFLP